MIVNRRKFLVITAGVGAGLALTRLGIQMEPTEINTDDVKVDKLEISKQSKTICPLCNRMWPCTLHR